MAGNGIPGNGMGICMGIGGKPGGAANDGGASKCAPPTLTACVGQLQNSTAHDQYQHETRRHFHVTPSDGGALSPGGASRMASSSAAASACAPASVEDDDDCPSAVDAVAADLPSCPTS